MLSIVAINFVWIRAVGIAIYGKAKRATSGPTREQIFFRTHLGLYLVSLLLGNLMSSIGYAINIDWVTLGGVREGMSYAFMIFQDTRSFDYADTLCSTQGTSDMSSNVAGIGPQLIKL